MAQVIIEHPDGRRYEVSEQAFKDLYEPFGFAVQGLYYNGAIIPDTEANRKKAEAGAPEDALTAENAARTVILSDLEAEARAKAAKEAPPTAKADKAMKAEG